MLTAYTVVLLFTVVALYWYSATHHGLGNDDGSSIALFGWRFTPSLFAVLYVQMTAMLLDEVKRTEPFARMARPGGAPASFTILQAPGAWWNALSDGLSSKKNPGRRNWVLFSSALVNVIGFLAISPLSPSLLESANVAVPRGVEFSRLVPRSGTPLPLNTDRETYVRIIGNLLQNISTSAWISDSYTVLPAWPSYLAEIPLSPSLSSTPQTWAFESLVFSTELDCQPMSLVRKATAYESHVWTNNQGHNYTSWNLNGSVVLESEDGCSWGVEFEEDSMAEGGSFWSQLSRNGTPSWRSPSSLESNFSYPYTKANHSEACGNRELIVMSTPWFRSHYEEGSTPDDPTFLPDFKITGQICMPHHYVATIQVKAVLTDSSSQVNFDLDEYLRKRTEIPNQLLNLNNIQNITLKGNWTTHITIPQHQDRPIMSDLSILLAAQLNFDMSAMTKANDIVARAERIKQRIFGEALQLSLLQNNASETDLIKGIATTNELRVFVLMGVAITLIALLTASLFLLLLVWTASRHHRRALNLTEDPATTTAIASLVTKEARTRASVSALNQASKREIKQALCQKGYYTTRQALHELDSAETTETSKSLIKIDCKATNYLKNQQNQKRLQKMTGDP